MLTLYSLLLGGGGKPRTNSVEVCVACASKLHLLINTCVVIPLRDESGKIYACAPKLDFSLLLRP